MSTYIPPSKELRSRVHHAIMDNAAQFSQKHNQHLIGLSAGQIARTLKVSVQSIMPHLQALIQNDSIEINNKGERKPTPAFLQTFAKYSL